MTPLSQSQLGIFYACQDLGENDGNYQVPLLYKLPDFIEVERLRRALELVVKGHPYILSRIVMEGDTPMMRGEEYSEEVITVREIGSIEEVWGGFCRTLDLMNERLIRIEIYKTREGNYLYLDIHHIILDGTGTGVLMTEIGRAYDEGRVNGEEMDGGEIANEERRLRESEGWKSQRDWYLKEFGDAAETDSMPVPTNMDNVENKGLVEKDFQVEVKRETIEAICKRYEVRESVVFLAAWGKILANYTAEERAFFGSIFAGRSDRRTRQAITMMVRTLPVYMEMQSDGEIGEWLKTVDNQQRATREKSAFSFADIHQEMNLRSDILFAYHGNVVPTDIFDFYVEGKLVKSEDLRIARPGITLDGQLFVTPDATNESDYRLRISYQSSLYTAEMIEGMAECYTAILNSMRDAEKIRELAATSEKQKRWLDERNPVQPFEYPKEGRVVEMFKEKVAMMPDAECCVYEERRYSYKQVGEMTDRLARMIIERIKCEGERAVVSYIVPRNELMVIVPVAIAKAGCTAQPLDSSYPAERLNFMIQDAEAQLLISTEEFQDNVNEYKGNRLTINSINDIENEVGKINCGSDLDDTSVLLYTSGTTGMPKGVMLTERNMLTLCMSHTRQQGIDSTSRVAAYASYGFDAYQMDLWGAMTTGAALHIIGEEIRYDLVAMEEYYEKEKITHAFMTTQVGTQMAINFPSIPSMKVMFVGGEKLVSIEPPQYRFINGYGPTETLAYVTSHEVRKNEKNIPIGFATPSARLYVVNKDGQRVPMGAAGELWISGPQTSKGYLKQPEKTALSFIDNPFNEGLEDYAMIYRTGDIVRYREDGAIEFIGRKDEQVKIRGFRIELKEVEAVIREFPGIKNVTVQAFDLEAGGKAIAAYIVAEGKIEIKQLNSFIMEQKPPYMVPAVTMQIEEIPLNVNGKINKKRLPKPVIEEKVEESQAAPLNRLEEELMEIVAEQVNCKGFSVTTPLKYVGLTSITSIKLSTRLFKRFGVTITNKELSQDATLQSIENRILENLLKPTSEGEVSVSTEEEKVAKAPISNAQMGVYYECMKETQSTAYNVPYIVRFPESVKTEKLKTAVESVIKAHPLLMVHFDNSSEEVMQVIERDAKPVVEVTERPMEEMRKDYVQPFDLSHGPLYHATVSGNALLFDVHHLIMDGSSVSIFIKDICRSIEGKEVKAESHTFMDYAIEEQKADNAETERFFDAQLATVDDATSLPADLHGNEKEGKQATAYQTVNHERVERYAKEHGITPASVYLAAIEYLAARYSNTKDVCICTVSSGRSDVRIADSVGMFVNTLVLVSHISDVTVEEYINNVAENFRETLDNENYPFAKIAERYGIDAELVFVYQLGIVERFEVNKEAVTLEEMKLSAPKFKVTILVEEHEGKVCLVAEYNDALYSENMMKRMLESLNQVVENMITQPQEKVTKVSILSQSQREEVARMNSIGTAPMPVRLMHKGMELWAEREPERMAVIACDRRMTYGEFDKSANRIANALIKRGVKRGDAVIVLLPRVSSTISCIFGIMKAGGAFIPCDPEYPADRIRLIAEDSGAPFVVTTMEHIGEFGEKGVLIDELVKEENDLKPDVEVKPTDLAYYIYTSGSTGKPKGVRVAHYNITTFITSSETHPMRVIMEECERLLSVATISFDASISEYGMALFNGQTFVFANEEESKDPIALQRLVEREKPDYIGCTTSRMLQYMEMPEFVWYMKNFKCILQGGEKFSEILLDRLRKVNDKCAILNAYGPTEISIGCNAVNLQNSRYLTVGKPLPNYTEWIIDKDGNELPVGVTGELCVGGDCVTQGYQNLPDKTAEKYIMYRGMRAFRTGDYARWMENGEVEILGRTDNQVKLRGLRIELGEVESAISQVEGVRNVLVKICNISGRDHLSAYYVAEREIDINEMKQNISHTLTAYMVPTAYLQMEKFPISPNGKVDFRNLPEPCLAQTEGDYVAPANTAERFFADTFAEILNMEKVGATDSFFELGGTSLVVMKVVINAQQAGYKLTYADVFANPTPRELALVTGNGISSEERDPDADVRDYDYSEIDKLLERNTIETFKAERELRPLGNVLLTGATGFLGIHILKCLVEQHPDSTVHCLLRSKHGVSAEERLRQLLFYYFEKGYDELFGKRIIVHEGDITSAITVDARIDTVINCAAMVKHFSQGTEIEDVNVGGVRNCIEYCLGQKARMIQVSTYSVAGASVDGEPDIKAYTEQMHYLGQRIHNQYIHSKIMGERMLLEAVVREGLDGKIMRVGNLSARSADGEFQINMKTNSFMGRLRIYQMLGAMSYSEYQSPVEFSPIDETAEAICLLAETNGRCVVFHPYNSHNQMLGDILREMKTIGRNVRVVEDEEFQEILNRAKLNPEKLSAMLAYQVKESHEIVRIIPADNDYTMQVLLRLGFRWNATSWDYVDKFLKQIDGMMFFEDK